MGEVGGEDTKGTPKDKTGSSEDVALSDNVELKGQWKLDFRKGEPQSADKNNSENFKSKKRKKEKETSSPKATNGNEQLFCTSKINPVISKLSKCVIAVHQNGLDLVTFELSENKCDPSRVKEHKKDITCLAVICDDIHVVSGGQDGQLVVWEIIKDNDSGVMTLEAKDKISFDVAILGMRAHPSNKIVLLRLESNLLKLRHINNLQVDEVSIEVQDSEVLGLSLNDDQIIYSTDKGHIYVWSYEATENPVFNFDTGKQEAQLVEVCGAKMASWCAEEPVASLWSLVTRQRLAALHLKHPPQHLSLFQEAALLLVVNSQHQLQLYQIRNLPPTEVRRNELASFESPVLSLTHGPACSDIFVTLESGSILHLNVTCDLKSDESDSEADPKTQNNGRKGSFSCQIL